MNPYSLLTTKQKRWLKSHCLKVGIKLNIRKFEGIIFILKSGGQWRLLPVRFGNWKSVYHYFRRISEDLWFSRMLKHLLNVRRWRSKGRKRKIQESPLLTVKAQRAACLNRKRALTATNASKESSGI
ncbi:MAG: transposase [Muribaculum sp.]|nr:transposase [Muribaculum sp.]